MLGRLSTFHLPIEHFNDVAKAIEDNDDNDDPGGPTLPHKSEKKMHRWRMLSMVKKHFRTS